MQDHHYSYKDEVYGRRCLILAAAPSKNCRTSFEKNAIQTGTIEGYKLEHVNGAHKHLHGIQYDGSTGGVDEWLDLSELQSEKRLFWEGTTLEPARAVQDRDALEDTTHEKSSRQFHAKPRRNPAAAAAHVASSTKSPPPILGTKRQSIWTSQGRNTQPSTASKKPRCNGLAKEVDGVICLTESFSDDDDGGNDLGRSIDNQGNELLERFRHKETHLIPLIRSWKLSIQAWNTSALKDCLEKLQSELQGNEPALMFLSQAYQFEWYMKKTQEVIQKEKCSWDDAAIYGIFSGLSQTLKSLKANSVTELTFDIPELQAPELASQNVNAVMPLAPVKQEDDTVESPREAMGVEEVSANATQAAEGDSKPPAQEAEDHGAIHKNHNGHNNGGENTAVTHSHKPEHTGGSPHGSVLGPDALLRLCRTNRWAQVLKHVTEDPNLGMMVMKSQNKQTTTILHQAIESKGDKGDIKRVITCILDQTPQAVSIKNSNGNLPIHLLVYQNGRGIDSDMRGELLPRFIDLDESTLRVKGGYLNRTPLHTLVAATTPLHSKVATLIDRCSYACGQPDAKGMLPVHVACSCTRNCSLETFRRLLEANPNALYHRTKEGQNLLDLVNASALKSSKKSKLIAEIHHHMREHPAPELASESLYTSPTKTITTEMKQDPVEDKVEDNDQARLATAAGSSSLQTPSLTEQRQSHSQPTDNGKLHGKSTEDCISTSRDVCCAPEPDDCVSFDDPDDKEDWTPESEEDYKLDGDDDEHQDLKATGVNDDDDKKEVLGESFGQQSSQTGTKGTNYHSQGSALGPDALLQLCCTNQWDLISQHVRKDPNLAMTKMKLKGRTTTILHQAIESEGDPEALKSIIAFILDKTPQASSITNSWGNFPIHTLTAYHGMGMNRNSRLELLPKFINADRETLLKKGGSLKRTPLHAHLAGRSRPSSVKQMIDHGSQACFMADDRGWLPVHLACSNHCSRDTLRILLKANPSALHHRTKEGQTLLEVAVSTATKAKPHFALIDEIRLQMNQTSDPMENNADGEESLPLGTRIKHKFQEGWFEGTVVDKEGPLYEIRYDDGDVEKMTLLEMKQGMEILSFPKGKKQEEQDKGEEKEERGQQQQEEQVAEPQSVSMAVVAG